jgi:hypothetical protein
MDGSGTIPLLERWMRSVPSPPKAGLWPCRHPCHSPSHSTSPSANARGYPPSRPIQSWADSVLPEQGAPPAPATGIQSTSGAPAYPLPAHV